MCAPGSIAVFPIQSALIQFLHLSAHRSPYALASFAVPIPLQYSFVVHLSSLPRCVFHLTYRYSSPFLKTSHLQFKQNNKQQNDHFKSALDFDFCILNPRPPSLPPALTYNLQAQKRQTHTKIINPRFIFVRIKFC